MYELCYSELAFLRCCCGYKAQGVLLTGDHVAVMINNLGGTSVLEMNIVAKEVIDWCGKVL